MAGKRGRVNADISTSALRLLRHAAREAPDWVHFSEFVAIEAYSLKYTYERGLKALVRHGYLDHKEPAGNTDPYHQCYKCTALGFQKLHMENVALEPLPTP